MAVIFPKWTNRVPVLIALGAPVVLLGVILAVWYWFSPKFTDVGYAPLQPVPFSHALHAGDLGLDCRYCHNTVEQAAHAAVPPTETCMNCHTQVRGRDRDVSDPDSYSPALQPVADAWATGEPIRWVRVHMLPDYAYFDHSVHLAAGVGCSSCHGRIDTMDVVRQAEPLSMSWCLDCHRNPEPHLRPRDEVTNMAWDLANNDYDPSADPHRTREVNPPQHCSGCHR